MKPTDHQIREITAALIFARKLHHDWRYARSSYRKDAVAPAIEALQKTRKPLTKYLQTRPHIGRKISKDPYVILGREVTHLIALLKKMQRDQEASKKLPKKPPSSASLYGTIGRVSSVCRSLTEEIRGIRKALGGGSVRTMPNGGSIISMRELNEEAERIIVEANKLSGTLNRKWCLWREGMVSQQAFSKNPYDEADAIKAMEQKVVQSRQQIARVRAAAFRDSRRTEPIPRALGGHEQYEHWDLGQVLEAWMRFYKEYGRTPTARELNKHAWLPSYQSLSRVVGKAPITILNEIFSENQPLTTSVDLD